MLFYALSFKDSKCFCDPHFGYFVTIELFHCVLFELLYSTLFISLCHLCLVCLVVFCVSPLLEDKQGFKFGGVMSILNTHFILMFCLIFSSFMR